MAGLSDPIVVLLMGVSGSGKSTIGTLLAAQLGASYFDADSFHSPEAIAKMQSGTPLDDRDRMPWLARIAQKIELLVADDESGVIGCSALKRAYRDILFDGIPRERVALVYLRGSYDLIRGRLAQRTDHFMPASLLESQFKQLEEPSPDERAIKADIAPAPDAIVAAILRELTKRGAAAGAA
ncbi:gluconokinase [Dongia sedimenti]|uniref:Gluconokinase n=1 Tax=Dongia sedimenti TaxID=3064282 RepID=A0ABU0YW80_9PROT|nr:gluconokinase [Rhodospirillaceae bacterium R-7]